MTASTQREKCRRVLTEPAKLLLVARTGHAGVGAEREAVAPTIGRR
jgi:hypothetical protein